MRGFFADCAGATLGLGAIVAGGAIDAGIGGAGGNNEAAGVVGGGGGADESFLMKTTSATSTSTTVPIAKTAMSGTMLAR